MKIINKKNVLFLVFMLSLGLTFLLHFIVPSFIVKIKNPVVNILKPTIKYSDYSGNKIYLKSKDNLSLVGLHSKSKVKKKGSVILLHGIRGGKEHFNLISKFLNNNSYDTFAFDLRAHGESGGIYCTFGNREKYDVSTIVDYIIKVNNDYNINIWGQSLGGAIAIQSLAKDKRIKLGIIESTFSNFRNIVHDYAKDFTGYEIHSITDYLINRAGEIAEFDPDNISPFRDCSKITQPILIAHGNIDDKIDISYGIKNYNNLKSNEKKFIEINDAGHFNLWEKGGDEYFQEVLDFLDSYYVYQNKDSINCKFDSITL